MMATKQFEVGSLVEDLNGYLGRIIEADTTVMGRHKYGVRFEHGLARRYHEELAFVASPKANWAPELGGAA